jgi:hypothetical protein
MSEMTMPGHDSRSSAKQKCQLVTTSHSTTTQEEGVIVEAQDKSKKKNRIRNIHNPQDEFTKCERKGCN